MSDSSDTSTSEIDTEVSRPYDVVVGVDGSKGAATALRWAIGHAEGREGAILRPVTAWHAPLLQRQNPFLHRLPSPDKYRRDAIAEAAALIEAMADDQGAVPIAPVEALEGSAGEVLTERAREGDLLVVGSRGRSELAGFMLGSVSTRCCTSPWVPTVVVPGTWTGEPSRPRSITVGVDGSIAADQAAVWARTRFPEAEITLLQTWLTPVWYMVEPPAGPRLDFGALTKIELERHSERIAGLMPDDAEPCSTRLIEGDARSVLTERVDTDLLVLGAQHNHGLKRALLGSVAQSVLHHLAQPTAIVPERL